MNTKITELNPEDLAMVAGGQVRVIVFADSEGMVIVAPKPKPAPKPQGGRRR